MLIVDETELKIGSKNWCDKSRRSSFFFFFFENFTFRDYFQFTLNRDILG